MTETGSTEHDGVLERTDDGGVVRFVRRLPFPVAAVWHAITDPERLADWWLPFDADITADLRVGGRIVMTGKDEDVTMTATITALDPPVLLEHTHGEGGSVRWELAAVDGGTEPRLRLVVPDVQTAVDECHVVGLHTSLDRLEPALAGRPVRWDWDAFAAHQARYARAGLAPEVTA